MANKVMWYVVLGKDGDKSLPDAQGFELPPLTFTVEGLSALVLTRRTIPRSAPRRQRRALGADGLRRRRGAETERTVVPLGLYFWGKQWLLAADCLLRIDYRSFRVDRVRASCHVEPDPARLESPGTSRTLG